MNNKYFIIVVIILLLVAGISLASYLPTRTDATAGIRVADFPMNIGAWKGTEVTLDERTYEILETRNLFIREYKNTQGQKIYLYIVYSEDNRKVSHPPEVCMLGSGATVADKVSVQLTNDIRANKLTVETPKMAEIMVYWYKAGDYYTDKYLHQQIKVVLDRIRGKRTSCAMVRLSTVIENNDPQAALGLIKHFAGEISPLLSKFVP